MSVSREIIEALKAGKKVNQRKCPICGNPLKVVIFGYLTNEMGKFIEKNHQYLIEGGCMCFMDDRDPTFECPKCHGQFTETLEQIKLIPCPFEASHSIHESECRNYELLEHKEHYELMEDRDLACNTICPLLGKRVRVKTIDGSVFEGVLNQTWRKFIHSKTIPDYFLSLSNERGKYHSDYSDIPISDISEIKEV